MPFLETAYALPRTHAATLTSMLFVGWGVGAPLFGWLSDRIGRRKAPLLAGLALETLALAALVYVPGLPVSALAGLCFLVGFLGSSQIVCFALAKENHPAARSGTAIGFVNAMVTGAGALFQPLVGFLLDLAWTGEIGARRARLPNRRLSPGARLADRLRPRRSALPARRARDLLPPASVIQRPNR